MHLSQTVHTLSLNLNQAYYFSKCVQSTLLMYHVSAFDGFFRDSNSRHSRGTESMPLSIAVCSICMCGCAVCVIVVVNFIFVYLFVSLGQSTLINTTV